MCAAGLQQMMYIVPVPSIIIIILINAGIYSKLWLVARKHRRVIAQQQSLFPSNTTKPSHKANLMVFIIVLVFALLWLPYTIVSVVYGISTDDNITDAAQTAMNILALLGFSNSVINCIVYVAMNKHIKQVIKRKLTCKT